VIKSPQTHRSRYKLGLITQNVYCIHCGSQGNYEKELNLEEIRNILGQLSLFGVKNFQITGGEPSLRADFIEVLAYANEKGLITSFATN